MKIELIVSYAEKDVAKRNGAKWDSNAKRWYLESQNVDELSTKLDMIAKNLNKKVEDIVSEIPKELTMSSKELIEKIFSMIGMIDGNFTEEKPEDAKTVMGWLKEGSIPVSVDSIKTYKFSPDGKTGYQYVAKSDIREMTEEEKSVYEEVMAERRKKSAKKSAQTRAENKAKESVKKESVRNRLDAINSFLEFKGLTKDFSVYYDEYCKNHPVTEKQKTDGIKKNNKKIKHLPDYAAIQGKRILCFDTETTGLSPDKGDELLQAALVSLDNGEIKTQFESLIKPHEKTSWVGAMIKNHISPKMVENAPYPEDIKNQVQEIIDQADVIVGYNVDFDINFLEKGMGIDFSGKIIADPSDYFRQNKPESSSFNLEACVTNYCSLEDLKEYKIGAHKADTDAIATLKAFCAQSKLEGYDLFLCEENEMEEFER